MRNFLEIFTTSLLLISASAYADEATRLYFWTKADVFPKLHLSKKLKTSDPQALNIIAHAELSKGFLVAPSPVTLRQRGGNDDGWVLIELTTHPEFKTIDATPEFLAQQNCPTLTVKTQSLPSDCLKSLNALVSAQGIDGLKLTSGEILLASGKTFKAADIRIFNRQTTDAAQDRLKIQSLFYRADFEHFKSGITDSLFPSEINRLNPPFSGGGRGLLWDDLDGKPLDLDH